MNTISNSYRFILHKEVGSLNTAFSLGPASINFTFKLCLTTFKELGLCLSIEFMLHGFSLNGT